MAQPSFPAIPKDIPRWMYEAFRRLQQTQAQNSAGLAAVGRGENPDGSGLPSTPNLSQYFFLPGRAGGQIGYGGSNPNDDLFLGSTRDAAKGMISLGAILLVDEGAGYVGINRSAPEVALDVRGTGNGTGGTLLPNADRSGGYNDSGLGGWAPDDTDYYTGSGTSVPGAHWFALSSNDGTTSWVAMNGGGVSSLGNGTNPERLSLAGTIIPGNTYTVTASVFALGSSPTAGFMYVELSDDDGNLWRSETLSLVGWPTTPTTYTFTVTCSGFSVGTDTPNGIALSAGATINVGVTGIYVCVSYIAVNGPEDIQRWHDSGDTLLAWVDSTGMFDMPQITLRTGASTGAILTDSGGGLGAWASAASLATRVQYDWRANGPYQVGVGVDGKIRVPSAFTITSVRLYRTTAGSSGTTIVDLNKNGTTMFTTQANRPQITAASGNDQSSSGTLPDVTSVAAGDVLSIDIDQIEGGNPMDFVLMIEGA